MLLGQDLPTYYGAAQAQGLSPLRAISKAYGFKVDASGTIDGYSTTVERWVHDEARNKLDFLPSTTRRNMRRDGGHPREPRRARPMMPEVLKRKGPYSGRTLTLHYRPIPPRAVNAAGEEVADVEIIGLWSDGKPLDDNIEPLRAVTLIETVTNHLLQLNAEFETKYPGARIRATSAAPELPRLATG